MEFLAPNVFNSFMNISQLTPTSNEPAVFANIPFILILYDLVRLLANFYGHGALRTETAYRYGMSPCLADGGHPMRMC